MWYIKLSVTTPHEAIYSLCIQVPLLKFHSEEPTIWSRLNHKNVVNLYGVLRRGQKIYFLEEFIDGELSAFAYPTLI